MTKSQAIRLSLASWLLLVGLSGAMQEAAAQESASHKGVDYNEADVAQVLATVHRTKDGKLVCDLGPVEELDRTQVSLPEEWSEQDGVDAIRMQCGRMGEGWWCCMNDDQYMCCYDNGDMYCG